MSAGFIIDKAYQERVNDVLLQALMVGLKDPETGIALWRTGEILNAMIDLQAMLLAGSEMSSPAKIREFAEDVAKRIRRRTIAFKEHFAEHGAPFPTYTVEGDFH